MRLPIPCMYGTCAYILATTISRKVETLNMSLQEITATLNETPLKTVNLTFDVHEMPNCGTQVSK